MRPLRSFAIYWLPVIIWMVLIFSASGDAASFKRSSRLVGPLLNWLFPNLSPDSVILVVTIVRKCAHLTEFAILAILVWRARRMTACARNTGWRWSQAAETLWVAIFYAATDEFHQTFVPSREGCVRDVMIDSAGAVAGLLLIWIFGRWRKMW